jgi:hypothetical protein
MLRSCHHAVLLGVSLVFGAGCMSAAAEPGAAVAAIAVEPSDNGILLVGKAVALAPASIDARMTIERSGSGGRMSTSHGGAFTLEKGSSVDVASVGLSMAPGDRLSVELVLSKKGQPIARSVVEVGE